MKNKKGFTLVELLSVIIIIGILSVITVPIILNTIENARVSTMKINVRNYLDALAQAINDNKTKANFPIRETGGCYNIVKEDSGERLGVEDFTKVQGTTPTFSDLQGICIQKGKINNDIWFTIDNYYGKYDASTDEVLISKTDEYNASNCSQDNLNATITAVTVEDEDLSSDEWTYKDATLTAGTTCSGEEDDGTFTYQWYKDETKIPGAKSKTYTANETGNYTVSIKKVGIANNIQSTFIYSKDTTEPTCSLALNGTQDETGAYTSDVTITLTPNPTSTLSGLEVAIANGDASPEYSDYTNPFTHLSTTAGENKRYVGHVKTGAGKTATCETTFTRKSYTGIPTKTYAAGETVTYAGINWLVVKDNGNNTTLVAKENYTTGSFGTSASFALGNNAYDQVNTNFVNTNANLKSEITSGAVVLDSSTNSYVRIPKKSELSTNIKNYSGTNFWTMTADGNSLYYGLMDGGNTYTKYSVISGDQKYYSGYTKNYDNLIPITLNSDQTSTTLSNLKASYSATKAVGESFTFNIQFGYLSTGKLTSTPEATRSVSTTSWTDIGIAPAFTANSCEVASGPNGTGTTRTCMYACMSSGNLTSNQFNFDKTNGELQYCGENSIQKVTYEMPATSLTANGHKRYYAPSVGPITATKTTSGVYGTTVTYSCPDKSSLSIPSGSGPEQFKCSSNCSKTVYSDTYYYADPRVCRQYAQKQEGENEYDMGIRPVITVREK